jgi:hypothetical protein
MFIIQKITQSYDSEQDRIGLTVENTRNQVLVLWLTQRLANQMAAALVKWLDEEVKPSASEQTPPSNVQACKQSVAQAKMVRGKPVDRAAAKGQVLLNTVELVRGPKGYTLIFKWGSDGAARMMLTPTRLRQLLIILYRQFDKAGWSKHVWPEWFAIENERGSPSTMRSRLH